MGVAEGKRTGRVQLWRLGRVRELGQPEEKKIEMVSLGVEMMMVPSEALEDGLVDWMCLGVTVVTFGGCLKKEVVEKMTCLTVGCQA